MITDYNKFQAKLFPVLPFLIYRRIAEFKIEGLLKKGLLR